MGSDIWVKKYLIVNFEISIIDNDSIIYKNKLVQLQN